MNKLPTIRAQIPSPYRELLRRYTVLLNTERRKRGLRPVSAAQVAGAMICFLLDHQQQSILDGYETHRTELFRTKFASLLGDDLATPAAETTGTAKVSDPRRAPWR